MYPNRVPQKNKRGGECDPDLFGKITDYFFDTTLDALNVNHAALRCISSHFKWVTEELPFFLADSISTHNLFAIIVMFCKLRKK